MQSPATSPEEYIAALPEDRKQPLTELRKIIKKNLPAGFKEIMAYGMIGYVVPHSLYPKGYHCDPKLPLMFISIGSLKNYISVHHMGIYADTGLLTWFREAYAVQVKTKLDMGKGCIRFKKPDQMPLQLIGELVGKMTPQQWIEKYEKNILAAAKNKTANSLNE